MGVLYCYYHLSSQNFTGRHNNAKGRKVKVRALAGPADSSASIKA